MCTASMYKVRPNAYNCTHTHSHVGQCAEQKANKNTQMMANMFYTCLGHTRPGPTGWPLVHPTMHRHVSPNWEPNLAPDCSSTRRGDKSNSVSEFLIRLCARFARIPAWGKLCKTIRIKSWIPNCVAEFRPDLPLLGGMRAAQQMLADYKPDCQPSPWDPDPGSTPTHAHNRKP